MKTITKTFKTLSEAADYQDELYSEYRHVRLVGFPSSEESGVYTWRVCD